MLWQAFPLIRIAALTMLPVIFQQLYQDLENLTSMMLPIV